MMVGDEGRVEYRDYLVARLAEEPRYPDRRDELDAVTAGIMTGIDEALRKGAWRCIQVNTLKIVL